MRGLIILASIAVVFAAPQYNYQPQHNGGSHGSSAAAPQPSYQAPVAQPQYHAPVAQPQYHAPAAQPQYQAPAVQPQYHAPAAQQQYQAPVAQPQYQPQAAAPSFASSPAASAPSQVAAAPVAQAPATYHKQFFIHSAPEDSLDEGASSSDSSSSLSRSLRVVIVKAPENKGLENAALQLAKSASEQQTAIYVLNKQTDIGELQTKLSQIQDQKDNKPEVHFIKYKTPEEAQFAQQAIQNQYNALPGPSQVSDEGVASVQDFAGGADGSGATGGAGGGLGGVAAGTNGLGGGSALGGGNGFGGQAGGGNFADNAAGSSPSVQNTYLPSLHRL